MKNNPPSWHNGIYNVSVLFGCGVSSKRAVGMVSSNEFNKTFAPHIAEALSKFSLFILVVLKAAAWSVNRAVWRVGTPPPTLTVL